MGAGGRRKTVSDEELLEAIRASEPPTVNAHSLAEEVPLSRRCVHARLMDLVEEGKVKTRTLGGDSRVWWIP